jgi:predicted nucleic acid-binding protein
VTFVLDAWALVAWLMDEPEAERVDDAMDAKSVVSWINLGEVYYVTARKRGASTAAAGVQKVLERVHAEEAEGAVVLHAARVRAEHRLSYADAFAVATAERHDAPLMTGDPEIVALERRLVVIDLRVAA